MAKMKLTTSQIINIFGKKPKIPDECIVELAMNGIKVTSSMLLNIIETTVLKIADSKYDVEVGESSDFKSMAVLEQNSMIILGNLARIMKYTTEFNKAMKQKNFISKLAIIQKKILENHMDKYRYNFVSDLYEAVGDLIDIVKDKEF